MYGSGVAWRSPVDPVPGLERRQHTAHPGTDKACEVAGETRCGGALPEVHSPGSAVRLLHRAPPEDARVPPQSEAQTERLNMNRRGFLRGLTVAAAAIVFRPDLLVD